VSSGAPDVVCPWGLAMKLAVDRVAAELAAALDDGAILSAPHERARFESGWRHGAGSARLICRPAGVSALQNALRVCSREGVRVVPQGANTGLLGGSSPDDTGEMVVLSLERMCRTIEVDADSGTVLVDAGVRLSQLQAALRPHGLWWPVRLASDPQIGGMVAAGAMGDSFLRHGGVRDNLLGLEVVLADGTLVGSLNQVTENNTGFDPKHLFVGSAGSLGVVSRAVLRVRPLPRQHQAVLFPCRDAAEVMSLLGCVQPMAGELLSAFEVASAAAIDAVLRNGVPKAAGIPFGDKQPGYVVLAEFSTTIPDSMFNQLRFVNQVIGNASTVLGIRPKDVVQMLPEHAWAWFAEIGDCVRQDGWTLSMHIGVPRARLLECIAFVRGLLVDDLEDVKLVEHGGWALGSTQLHFVWPADNATQPSGVVALQIEERVLDAVVRRFDGTWSAEHGVGPASQRLYDRYSDAIVRDLCRVLRDRCDPQRLLGRTRLD
jgi:FAD/FMN-containing dehydrogenase